MALFLAESPFRIFVRPDSRLHTSSLSSIQMHVSGLGLGLGITVFYPYHNPSLAQISSSLLVDTSESLFNLLGQSIQVTLDLLLVRRVWVFEFHLRELENDIGSCVSDLKLISFTSSTRMQTGNWADLGECHVARLDGSGTCVMVVDKVLQHAHSLVEGTHSVVLRDTVLLQEVILAGVSLPRRTLTSGIADLEHLCDL